MSETGVLAVFAEPAQAARAVRAARAAGCSDIRAAMPAPYPEVVEALGRRRSALGRATFAAALTGAASGFALCIGTALDWPLMTGGKPIASLPPSVIIAFECTVLVSALVTLATLLIAVARGRRGRGLPGNDARFSCDRIGIFVSGGDPSSVEGVLRQSGAEEVRRVA